MKNTINESTNRRKYPRKTTDKDPDIRIAHILFQTEDHFQIGKTKNISASGINIDVNKYITPLTKVQGVLKLPLKDDDKNHINFKGIVVRTEPETEIKNHEHYNIAIFFNDMQNEEKEKIDEYLDSSP